MAVLETALQDIGKGRREAEKALAWMQSDSTTWMPLSFLYVCEHLQLDPDYLRSKRSLEAVREAKVIHRVPPTTRLVVGG